MPLSSVKGLAFKDGDRVRTTQRDERLTAAELDPIDFRLIHTDDDFLVNAVWVSKIAEGIIFL